MYVFIIIYYFNFYNVYIHVFILFAYLNWYLTFMIRFSFGEFPYSKGDWNDSLEQCQISQWGQFWERVLHKHKGIQITGRMQLWITIFMMSNLFSSFGAFPCSKGDWSTALEQRQLQWGFTGTVWTCVQPTFNHTLCRGRGQRCLWCE